MSTADTSHLSLDNSSVFSEAEGGEEQGAEQVQETDQTAQEGEEGESQKTGREAEEGDHQEAADDLDSLIEQFAKEHGLDLNNPQQRKLAKRLADREVTYRQQKAEIEKLKTASPQVDYLSEFDKELSGPAEGQKKAEAAKAPEAEAKPQPKGEEWKPLTYRDVGEPFKDDEDLLTRLNDAWRDGQFQEVSRLESARFKLQFANMLPLMRALVEGRINEFKQKELAQELQPVRQTVEERTEAKARDTALAQLRKVAEFKGVFDEMFKADGEDLTYNGESYDNSPINRIFLENPELLNIQVSDPDQYKAAAKTHFARYLAAAKIYARQKKAKDITGSKAKELIDTGAKIAQRESGQERVRQALNAGPGASGRTPPAKVNYGKELNDLEGSNSLSRLFSK